MKSRGKGGKSKNAGNEKDRCKKCWKITSPPHWARSCPETATVQVALTPVHRQRRPKRCHQAFLHLLHQRYKFGKCDSVGSHTGHLVTQNPKDLMIVTRQHDLRRLPEDVVENAGVRSAAQQTSDHGRRFWSGDTCGMSSLETPHDDLTCSVSQGREKSRIILRLVSRGHGVLRGPGRDVNLGWGRDYLVGCDEEVAACPAVDA